MRCEAPHAFGCDLRLHIHPLAPMAAVALLSLERQGASAPGPLLVSAPAQVTAKHDTGRGIARCANAGVSPALIRTQTA